MLKIIPAFLIAAGIASAAHAEATYDPATQILTVPSIEIAGVRFNFVELKITGNEVVRFSSSSQSTAGLPRICDPYTGVTQRNFNKIQNGMTLDDVNRLLGCQYKPPVQTLEEACNHTCGPYSFRAYTWVANGPFVVVNFDKQTGLSVSKSASPFISP
ncbi:hypothetical protein MASR1M59_03020 [Melaminivora sp.]